MNNYRRLLVLCAVTLWLGVLFVGFSGFHAYSSSPGTTGATPSDIPLNRNEKPRCRLILFAHPRCPCTRSTLAELAILLEICPVPIGAEVQFVRPTGMPADWEKTSLWQAAAAIPGVHVYSDEGGALARRLGAETSGQIVLYGPDGKLLFRGGITRSRGQEGDNAGRYAILSLLSGQAALAETPVFGCPLFTPHECCGKDADSCRP